VLSQGQIRHRPATAERGVRTSQRIIVYLIQHHCVPFTSSGTKSGKQTDSSDSNPSHRIQQRASPSKVPARQLSQELQLHYWQSSNMIKQHEMACIQLDVPLHVVQPFPVATIVHPLLLDTFLDTDIEQVWKHPWVEINYSSSLMNRSHAEMTDQEFSNGRTSTSPSKP
jgi:hypothetical protein